MTERWKPDEYVANFTDVIGLYQTMLPTLSQWVELKGRTFFDIGCGSGKWSALFACLGLNCVLLDNTPGMFDRVRKNFPAISKSFMFVFEDALEMENIPSATFDIEFSEGLYEHFLKKEDRIKFILNVHRTMKHDAIAIIMVPYKSGQDDEIHFELDELINEWIQIFNYVKGFKFSQDDTVKIIGVIVKKGDKS